MIRGKYQCCRQTNHITGRKKLSGRIIGRFSEFADQVFKHESHFAITDDVGM